MLLFFKIGHYFSLSLGILLFSTNTKFVVLICFEAYNISICQHMPILLWCMENVGYWSLTNDMDPIQKIGEPHFVG